MSRTWFRTKSFKVLLFLILISPLLLQAENEDELFIKGLNSYINREFKDAAYYWKKALELNPHNSKAQDYMEKAFSKYNTMQTFFYNGLSFFNEANYTNAIGELQETLMINPNHQKAIYYLELCYKAMSLIEQNQSIEETESVVAQLMQQNEFRRAVALYKVLVMLDPDNPELRFQLDQALLKLKDRDLKDELKLHLEAARDFSEQKKYLSSISEWSKVLIIDPEHEEAREGLRNDTLAQKEKERQEKINIYLSEGIDLFLGKQYLPARNAFQKVLTLENKQKQALDYIERIDAILKANEDERVAFNEAEKHFQQGLLYFKREEYYDALDEFQTALSLYEKHKEAPEYLKQTQEKIRELEEKKAREREDRIQALLEEGINLYELARYKKARDAFQGILDLEPENETALNYMSLIKDALELEAQSVVNRNSPYYHLYRQAFANGQEAFKRGDFHAAAAHFSEILALFPLNTDAREAHLKALARIDPERFQIIIEEHLRQGRKFLSEGNIRRAKKEFETVKEIIPDYLGIDDLIASCVYKPKVGIETLSKLFTSGQVFYEQNQFNEAIGEWQKIIALDSSPDSNPYYAKAILEINKAKKRMQLLGMEGAPAAAPVPQVKLDSDKEKEMKRHYYMGVAHYTEGNYAKAIEEWKKTLRINPNHAEALNNIKKAEKRLAYSQ